MHIHNKNQTNALQDNVQHMPNDMPAPGFYQQSHQGMRELWDVPSIAETYFSTCFLLPHLLM
jgi:hypothetical protein